MTLSPRCSPLPKTRQYKNKHQLYSNYFGCTIMQIVVIIFDPTVTPLTPSEGDLRLLHAAC